MEAVNQGSAAVGLKSKTHVVLVSLKRASSELSSHMEKVFEVDAHVGMALAGLAADGRVLLKHMRNEALNHKFVYDTPVPVTRLVHNLADKAQVKTQKYGRRPYGVGLIIGGCDSSGAHLYQFCPSGNMYDFYAVAIGSRSQSAKTYMERKFTEFADCSLEQLIHHGLTALKETAQDGDLNVKNATLCVLSNDKACDMYDAERIQPFLDALDAGVAPPAADASAMDTQ